MDRPTYAWCFDHGCMHTFAPDGAWCTAPWVAFPADTFAAAMEMKKHAYGSAKFMDQLPLLEQYDVVEMNADRRAAS
jgi:hypothetical protein